MLHQVVSLTLSYFAWAPEPLLYIQEEPGPADVLPVQSNPQFEDENKSEKPSSLYKQVSGQRDPAPDVFGAECWRDSPPHHLVPGVRRLCRDQARLRRIAGALQPPPRHESCACWSALAGGRLLSRGAADTHIPWRGTHSSHRGCRPVRQKQKVEEQKVFKSQISVQQCS